MSGYRAPNDGIEDPDDDELRTWMSDRRCPVCDVPMYTARKRRIGVDGCGGCGGVWLPSVDATKLLETRSAIPAKLARMAWSNSEKRKNRTGRPRSCPDCGTGLVVNGLCSGTIHVDLCHAHGTWFDPGELEPLVASILATKLDPEDQKVLDEMLDNRLDRFLEAIRKVMAGAS